MFVAESDDSLELLALGDSWKLFSQFGQPEVIKPEANEHISSQVDASTKHKVRKDTKNILRDTNDNLLRPAEVKQYRDQVCAAIQKELETLVELN